MNTFFGEAKNSTTSLFKEVQRMNPVILVLKVKIIGMKGFLWMKSIKTIFLPLLIL